VPGLLNFDRFYSENTEFDSQNGQFDSQNGQLDSYFCGFSQIF